MSQKMLCVIRKVRDGEIYLDGRVDKDEQLMEAMANYILARYPMCSVQYYDGLKLVSIYEKIPNKDGKYELD